jgi:predicted transcriptional regulator
MSTAAGKRQVSSHIAIDLVATLDQMAEISGASRSMLIEAAIRQFIKKQASGRKRRDRRLPATWELGITK